MINQSRSHNYQIKKQNSKIQSTTSIDQLKFNKNEDFYKALYKISNKINVDGIWKKWFLWTVSFLMEYSNSCRKINDNVKINT